MPGREQWEGQPVGPGGLGTSAVGLGKVQVLPPCPGGLTWERRMAEMQGLLSLGIQPSLVIELSVSSSNDHDGVYDHSLSEP